MNVEYLKPSELAARWSMSQGTLAQWRHKGKGPVYIKAGGVRYPVDAVLAFEQQSRMASIKPPTPQAES